MNEIQLLTKQSGLPELQVDLITQSYELEAIQTEVEKWQQLAERLTVTDEAQLAKMTQAAGARKAVAKIRISIEKTRKELKERSLNEGRLIDGIAKTIAEKITPLEHHFRELAEFAERAQAKRVAEMVARRTRAIKEAGGDPALYRLDEITEDEFGHLLASCQMAQEQRRKQAELEAHLQNMREDLLKVEGVNTQYLPLGKMPDDEFQQRLATARQAKLDKIEADRKAEEAREEAEKARAEQAKAEEAARAEREAARKLEAAFEAERRRERWEAELTAKKIKQEMEDREAAIRAEQARVEAELKARRDQEEADRKAKEEEARKLAEGPELQRIAAWADLLSAAVNQAPDGLKAYRVHVAEAVRRIQDIINDLPREEV